MKTFNKDLLKVNVYSSRDEMGAAAAADVKAAILRALGEKEMINMIFDLRLMDLKNNFLFLQKFYYLPVLLKMEE